MRLLLLATLLATSFSFDYLTEVEQFTKLYAETQSTDLELFEKFDVVLGNARELIHRAATMGNLASLSVQQLIKNGSDEFRALETLHPAMVAQFKKSLESSQRHSSHAGIAKMRTGYRHAIRYKMLIDSYAFITEPGYDGIFFSSEFMNECSYNSPMKKFTVLDKLLKTRCKLPTREDILNYVNLLDIISDIEKGHEFIKKRSYLDSKIVLLARFIDADSVQKRSILEEIEKARDTFTAESLREINEPHLFVSEGYDQWNLCHLTAAMVEVEHARKNFTTVLFSILDDIILTATMSMNCYAIEHSNATELEISKRVEEVASKVETLVSHMRSWTEKRLEHDWPEVMLKYAERAVSRTANDSSRYEETAQIGQRELQMRGLPGYNYQLLVFESTLNSDNVRAMIAELADNNYHNFTISGAQIHVERTSEKDVKSLVKLHSWQEKRDEMNTWLESQLSSSSCAEILSNFQETFSLTSPIAFSRLILLRSTSRIESWTKINYGVSKTEQGGYSMPAVVQFYYEPLIPLIMAKNRFALIMLA